MKKRIAIGMIVALALYACFATLAAMWLNLKCRSHEDLLDRLALVKPGIPIAQISSQLGEPMGEYTKEDDVFAWGTVKDKSFCRGKRLLRFHVSTAPCRTMDVYTDANGVIVYTTWAEL